MGSSRASRVFVLGLGRVSSRFLGKGVFAFSLWFLGFGFLGSFAFKGMLSFLGSWKAGAAWPSRSRLCPAPRVAAPQPPLGGLGRVLALAQGFRANRNRGCSHWDTTLTSARGATPK